MNRGGSEPTVITFIGAGSVVFTRELLADLLRFPELADAHLALHDIDPDRLETAEAIARAVAGTARRRTDDHRHPRPAGGARRRRLRHQHGPGRRHAATRTDFEVPARFGLRQTIADTLGVGGVFRALRTFPVLDGLAARHAEVCPDAWLLNYTNPMAMNVAYLARAPPALKALGLCHSVYWTVARPLRRCVGVPLEEVDLPRRRGQPPGVAAALGARRREPLPAARRADRGRPASCAGGCASTCTAGSATTRPRPASTPREYVPVVPPPRRARSSGCASRSATTSASARRTSRSTRPRARPAARRRAPRARRATRPSTRRRSSTPWSPARSAASTPTSPTTA